MKQKSPANRQVTSIRRKAIEGIVAGDRFCVNRTFAESEVDAFSEMSKDFNPVHFEEHFARERGFNGRICHGLLVGGMLTEIGGQIGWLAAEMAFQFKKPVYFGETVTCELVITRIGENGYAEAEAEFRNGEGLIVIEGRLTGYLPTMEQRRIMGEMENL